MTEVGPTVSGVPTRSRNEALLAWYRGSARSLPWRTAPDPYRVLVSEFMLQQTQAARVAPKFERFLERFPTIEALAAAPLTDVLAEWSGLGYNSRARRLRDSARLIVERGWPEDVDGLLELPGVGPYTAAAIASFAFGQRVPAVDTNLRRVLSRWFGTALEGRALEAVALAAIDDDASAWNQAVMDLGAGICRPRPLCDVCPVGAWCAGPDVYEAPRRQSRFEGSLRQRRGIVVRELVESPADIASLAGSTDHDIDDVAEAVDGLIADGLVEKRADGTLHVAD